MKVACPVFRGASLSNEGRLPNPRVCKNAMRQARRKNNDIFFFNVNETNFATLIGYLIDVEVGK
jgi:hypothetical protein